MSITKQPTLSPKQLTIYTQNMNNPIKGNDNDLSTFQQAIR